MLKYNLMRDLNPEQQKAINHLAGPLLILAGAGSGKTKVVTHRIAKLLEEGVHPESILALTFTNKAATEMRNRVHSLVHQIVTISTFHSFGARFLRDWAEAAGLSRKFSIHDEDDSAKVIKTVLAELGIKEKKGDVRIIKNLISEAKNELKNLDEVGDETVDIQTLNQFEQIFHKYQAHLKIADSVDFDDLLYLPLKILKENSDILERVRERYRYILVDEYQDTNQAQYELIKLIAGEHLNLFVVGDPDQSIYSWRGANIHNILNFEKDFPTTTTIRLEQNYRSTSRILEAANALIQNNSSRFEKNLWSELGEGSKIRLFVGYTERDEASFVAREIEHLNDKGIPLSQIVVFYRTNAQSRPFEDQLLNRYLSYKIVGGLSFYQRKEIKDILSYLKLVNQGADYVAFSRTIHLPKRGVGDKSVEKIIEGSMAEKMPILLYVNAVAHDAPLSHPISLTAKAKNGLKDYLSLIEKGRQKRSALPFHQFIKEFIEDSGYLGYLKEEEPETFDERRENLDELIAKAMEFEDLEDPLASFLEELTLKSDEVKGEDDHNRITLMTLHNGKGLEFKVAFIVGMEEDLLPHANSKSDSMQLEEERRLCYVGMTRAKELLYLTRCTLRYLWGVERFMRPSRFLTEIPAEYTEKINKI